MESEGDVKQQDTQSINASEKTSKNKGGHDEVSA